MPSPFLSSSSSSSSSIWQVFGSVEDAPLLVILDDLLQDLDQLLVQYEGRPDSAAEGEEGGGDMRGASKEGVDSQYVALLEMQCLLQQRMNDVQYRWMNIYNTISVLGKTPTNECDTLYTSKSNLSITALLFVITFPFSVPVSPSTSQSMPWSTAVACSPLSLLSMHMCLASCSHWPVRGRNNLVSSDWPPTSNWQTRSSCCSYT